MTVTIKDFDEAGVRATGTNSTGLVALYGHLRRNAGPAMSEED